MLFFLHRRRKGYLKLALAKSCDVFCEKLPKTTKIWATRQLWQILVSYLCCKKVIVLL